MRKAKSTARGAQLMPPLQSSSSPSSAVLLATALLLGCAGSALPTAAAAATTSAGAGGSASGAPAPSSGAPLRRPGPHSQEEREPLLPPLAPLAPRGGVGAGRTARPSWFAARTTRGGGLFRRRRNGGGGDGGNVGGDLAGAAAEEQKGNGGEDEEEEEAGIDEEQEQEPSSSEGFSVAAGTKGGSGRGGGSLAEEDGGEGTEDGADGGGSQSDEQPVPHVPPLPAAGVAPAALACDDGDGDGDGDDNGGEESGGGSGTGEGSAGTAGDSQEEEEEGGEEELQDSAEGTEGDDQRGGEGGESGEGEGVKATATEGQERRRPTAPLFSFPPGPRVRRTEDPVQRLEDVLPMQQRLVKYLTDDRVFGAQILLSAYFFMSAVAFSIDSAKFAGCYKAALGAITLKYWGTVVGRVRRVLVPHLLYEPQRYVKYRARVAALALDPAVQGIVYCAVFMMLVPLSHALLPLMLKEAVYLLWVIKEVLQIVAPGLVETLVTLTEPLMSVFMTAGDVGEWKETPPVEKRILLGRRLAQMCFKLEMAVPFSVALRILPGIIQTTLGAGADATEAGGGGEGGGIGGQIVRALPLIKVGVLMMAYVKLLTVKNAQLEDDVRILRGLTIRGYKCEWVEQAVDSVVFGKMVGCPWWVGLLASGFALLPNHEATKTVMASDAKLKTLGMTLLNLAIGRTPGADDDDDDDEDSEEDEAADKSTKNAAEGNPSAGKLAKIAKVAAVATGVSDD